MKTKTPLYEYIKDNWRVWGGGIASFAADYEVSPQSVNNWIKRENPKTGEGAYIQDKKVYSGKGAPLLDLTIRSGGYVPTIAECREVCKCESRGRKTVNSTLCTKAKS